MKQKLFWHLINCLTHPASMLAVLVLAVNALVLQPNWPSWWTGKIGDAAWMVVAPFLIAGVLIWLFPVRRLDESNRMLVLSVLALCAGFSLLKVVPGVNAAVVSIAASLGFPLKLALDPSDLIVLPFALLTLLIWQKKVGTSPDRAKALAACGLSALVLLADMAPPPTALDCLVQLEDNSIMALSNATHAPYRSRDGGLTWVSDLGMDEDAIYCSKYMAWPITLDTDPPIVFYFMYNAGLYQSTDNGKTLTLVTLHADKVTNVAYAITTTFDTVVLSTGNGDFWTRTPDGDWLHFAEKYPELLLQPVAPARRQ